MIVTCGHVIRNTTKIYGFKIINKGTSAIKFELDILVDAIEFDVAILKPKNNLLATKSFSNPLTINDLELTIPNINDKIKVLAMDTIDDEKNIFYKTNISNWLVKNISIEQIHSNNIPESVLIDISPDNLFESIIINYNGLSGSPCFNSNNKIIGLIGLEPTNKDIFDDIEINLFPSMIIYRVIKEYINNGMYNGVCTLYFDYIKLDEVNRVNGVNGIQVTNTYSILYENSKSKLKKGDILLEVSDNKIDENGNIYCPIVKYDIPIHTFIMLNYISNDIIDVNVKRGKQIKLLKIKAVPIWKYLYIPFLTNNEFVKLNNMIFVEISEDIIEHYQSNNTNLIGPFINVHMNNKYRNNKGNHIVVLFNVTDNKIKEKINNIDRQIIYSDDNIKCVPTLRKLNGKKINNIFDLKSKMKSIKKISIELETMENNISIKF